MRSAQVTRFRAGSGQPDPTTSGDEAEVTASRHPGDTGRMTRWVGGRWLVAFFLLVTGQAVGSQTEYDLPLVMSASNADRQGFARIINRSDHAGTVSIHAIDDTGRRFGPVTLSLEARGAAQFNSQDLERGNPGKGLSGGVGDGTGDWRLELSTTLDIGPLAYIRTPDGFLTTMHEGVREGTPAGYRVPIFNPGSNRSQVSWLRLINRGDQSAEITIDGLDDRGNRSPGGEVRLSLAAGAAHTLSAQQLEEGGADFSGRLGDGEGKWRLFVSSSAPIEVMSLMQTRSGHLANLSRGAWSGERSIPLVMSASNAGQQGFVRIINHSNRAGTVRIVAVDDTGQRFDPVSLSLAAQAAAQFNSQDLERGNSRKGLSGGVGDGSGNWRLELETPLDIEPLAYIRTPDGFLTSMHEVASEVAPMRYHVPIFNPGSNRSRVSWLRLINPGDGVAEVTIEALDDHGNAPTGGEVHLSLAAGAARMLSAQQLEEGSADFSGRFGDGEGKWQLFVTSDTPIQVMGLMQTHSGHLSNLSGEPPRVVGVSGRALLGPLAGATVTLESLHEAPWVHTAATAADDTDLETAGSFSFDLDLSELPPVVLLTAYGGKDLDADNDGVPDPRPTLNRGRVHAYVPRHRLTAPFTINPLTEIAYRELQHEFPGGFASLTRAEMLRSVDEIAAKYLDGGGTYSDLLTFDPTEDQARSRLDWDLVLTGLVDAIHAGAGSSEMSNRVAALSWQFDTEGAVNKDDAVIRRIAGAGEDRVVTTLLPDASGDLVRELEQVSVDPTGAMVRTRLTKVTGGRSRVDLSISHAGNTLSISGVSDLLEDLEFSEAAVRGLAAKLITLRPGSGGELLIDIDKGITEAISDGELTFRINGKQPTADQLDVVQDDPVISWNVPEESDDPLSRLRYVDIPNWAGAEATVVNDNLVVKMPHHMYGLLSGIADETSQNRPEQLWDLALNVGSISATIAAHTGLITAPKVVTAIGLYSGICTLQFHLGEGFPLSAERNSPSTRVELIGFRQHHERDYICTFVQGSRVREVNFHQEYPLILWLWLGYPRDPATSEIIRDDSGKPEVFTREVDLNVNGSARLLYDVERSFPLAPCPTNPIDLSGIAYVPVSPCPFVKNEPLESIDFGSITLESGHGYMILPPQTVTFGAEKSVGNLGHELISAEIELWQEASFLLFNRNLVYDVAVDSVEPIHPRFNADVLCDHVVLDARSSITPEDSEVTYTWSYDDPSGDRTVFLGQGSTLRVPRSKFVGARASFRAFQVTLDITAGRITKATTRTVALDGGSPWIEEVLDPEDEENCPDLTVSAKVSPRTVSPGDSVTISATVRNQGDATSPATRVRYYRSSDPTISASDTPVGAIGDVGSLSAGYSSSVSTGTTALSSPGTYYYGACVDSVSDETNTQNNCSTATFVVVKRNDNAVVDMPDGVLRRVIEGALGKSPGEAITQGEMASLGSRPLPPIMGATQLTGLEYATGIQSLVVVNSSITDLSPLAGLTSLRRLDVSSGAIRDLSPSNSVSDLSPLRGLTNLTYLYLKWNSISDLSPLEGLTSLGLLDLGDNAVSDLSPLEELTSLVSLDLSHNSVSDLSPLKGFTSLQRLLLSSNSISDISPLEGLTNLRSLDLPSNSIRDISPLVRNQGLGNGDQVRIFNNPLSSDSINVHIPALRARGVDVSFF